MEKDLERYSATDDLLSQSYCIGIQKIAGTKNDISNNFQIPEKILAERKKAWDNLFEKYSSMVSETELNINTLQLEDPINLSETVKQRLPMRKPMSMVQYWVDTGNLVHTNCRNDSFHSDSGSSIIENYCFEPIQNIDSLNIAADQVVEKYSNIAETSGNKNLRIVTSSNSSVDTAVYILANNNITKKAEATAIVEGSKVITKTQSPTRNILQIMETNKSSNKIGHEKSQVKKIDFPQSFISASYVDKITENLKNANFDKMCKNKRNSKSTFSIFFSDSDESQVSNIQKQVDQTSNDLKKFIKRKKLYNRSDSPAEFTPVSEDNLSLQKSSMLLHKCLPLKKSEHPALETPKTSLKFPFCTRYRQTQLKKKLVHHQCSSLASSVDENNEIQELFGPSQNNNLASSQTTCNESNSQNGIHSDKMQPFSKRVQRPIDFFKNKFKLKSCKVVVQRLPYKYHLSNSNRTTTKNKYSTFNSTKTFGDILNCREKEKKLSRKTNSNYSSDKLNLFEIEKMATKRLDITNNEVLSKTKYVIADSSSDESDLIMPSSITKDKSVDKSKNPKRFSRKDVSHQPPKNVNSKKELVKSVGIEQNDKYSNTSTDQGSNQDYSNKQDVRHRHFTKRKNKIRETSFSGEAEEPVNIATKRKQASKSTSAIISESKNTYNSMKSCRILLNGFHQTNNKVTTYQKIDTLNEMPNKRDASFNADNSENLGSYSNSALDDNSSPNNQKNKLSPTKRVQQRDKSQKMPDSAKVKTPTTQKASKKKRKSFEIDLSSDEECIIPLKRKE